MKKTKLTRVAFGAMLLVACTVALFARINVAHAADEKPAFKMDIYPAQNDLKTIEQGKSYSGTFTVENSGVNDFGYEVSVSPYSVVGENYDPDYSTETQYTDIVKWITTNQKNGSLRSGEKIEIGYTVDVPEGVHGGAQAAVIMVTMQQNNDSSAGNTGVQTVRQLGYLVFGNVDGEVTKTGKVLENKVPSFLFNPPIIGTSVVENTGNVYTAAKYSLQVFPLFSDEEIYTNEETPDNNIVFPETKRFNQVEWEGAPHLGIFRVRQTVEIFDDKSVTEKLVFLCPLWFLFIVILLIFCVIFWIIGRVIKRKKEA